MNPSALEALYRLQQIDANLEELTKKVKDSDEAAAVADASARAASRRLQQEKAERELASATEGLRRLERELSALDESLQLSESRLYRGEVTSPKELASLQDRIDLDRKRKTALEEEVLAAMEDVERAESEYARAEEAAAEAREKLGRALASLEEAKAKWKNESVRLGGVKAKLRERLPSELLALYDALHDKLGGRPVALVNERACGGCHVELPTAMRRPTDGQTLRCPNCGRLLWWP